MLYGYLQWIFSDRRLPVFPGTSGSVHSFLRTAMKIMILHVERPVFKPVIGKWNLKLTPWPHLQHHSVVLTTFIAMLPITMQSVCPTKFVKRYFHSKAMPKLIQWLPFFPEPWLWQLLLYFCVYKCDSLSTAQGNPCNIAFCDWLSFT